MRVPESLVFALFVLLLACLTGCVAFLEDYSYQPLSSAQTEAY